MHCDKCGSYATLEAVFCSKCGERLGVSTATQVADKPLPPLSRETAVLHAGDVARKASKLARSGVKSEMGKSVAGGAALGALIAMPIPFVGPLLGAAVGAAIGVYRKL